MQIKTAILSLSHGALSLHRSTCKNMHALLDVNITKNTDELGADECLLFTLRERERESERERSRMINVNICSLNKHMNCKKERKNKIK